MPPTPVQQKIYIDDIRDGVIFTKDGNLRAVLMTTSTNFALKSTEEQDAIILKYQNFINSLDFSVQILAVSRRLDISDYVLNLEHKRKEQPNELLRIQIAEYIDFIKNLIQISNIMAQSFYVVVPLSRVEKKEGGIIEKLGLFNKKEVGHEQKTAEELKSQLWQRVEYVAGGLGSIGIKAVPLNTQELIELFYRLYNMGAKETPILKQ